LQQRDSVVQFKEKNQDIKFKTVSAWIDYIFFSDGKIEKKHFAVIGLTNTNLDVHIIHPISQFITDNWKNRAYNTQRKHSNNTVQFLNYLMVNKRKLKVSSLKDLRICHLKVLVDRL